MPASCGGSHAADIKLPVIEQASILWMPASCGGSHAADIKLPVIEQASFLRMPHAGCRLNPFPNGERARIRLSIHPLDAKHLIFRCRMPVRGVVVPFFF
jgi:hypothetical protein